MSSSTCLVHALGGAPVVAADSGLPDAAQVHRLLKSLQGAGNELRLNLIHALQLLYDGNLFFELGYSSYHQYCDRELGLSHTTCYEYLRVAMALEHLPAARAIYAQGDLSWEQLRAISRVASEETEKEWLELAFKEPVGALLAEVKEAQRTGRDRPSGRRFGLPNLWVDVHYRVTLEERERLRAAFRLVSAAAPPDPEDMRVPLVRLADAILSGAIPLPASPEAGGNAAVAPAQTILYRVCPTCRAATLDTQDGRVSVAPERITELDGVSNRVVITEAEERPAEPLPSGQTDPPNDPRLVRKVLHRDGLRCANPGCGRRQGLHAHHIVFRSEGGRTAMSNEVTVCDRCHALIHQGLLEVEGSPDKGLTWRRRPLDPSVKLRNVRELGADSPLPDASQCAAAHDEEAKSTERRRGGMLHTKQPRGEHRP